MIRPQDSLRVISSVIADELRSTRNGQIPRKQQLAWTDRTELGTDGIGLDSLELTGVASAVSSFFCLHETGVEDRLLIDRTIGAWASLCSSSIYGEPDHLRFTSVQDQAQRNVVEVARVELFERASCLARSVGGVQRICSSVALHTRDAFVCSVLLPQLLGATVCDYESAEVALMEMPTAGAGLLVLEASDLEQIAAVRGAEPVTQCVVIDSRTDAFGNACLMALDALLETASLNGS